VSAKYVRDHYGVDYKRGDRLVCLGRHGTLVSFPDQYLGIRFDGNKRTSRCHPTWMTEREAENWPMPSWARRDDR
jgi:hypothetical protein